MLFPRYRDLKRIVDKILKEDGEIFNMTVRIETNRGDATIELYKDDDGRWHEEILEDEIGIKQTSRYMSYLSIFDILKWLSQDFPGSRIIVECINDYSIEDFDLS